MKLIVGLGNPGREYSETRHNIGWMVLDVLAKRWEGNWRLKDNAEVLEARREGEVLLLVKPQTYMNLSGEAVAPLARFYKVPAEDVIVIYDDMDLPTGKLRLRMKGGSGGHRGIESLLYHLRQDTFNRVRLGIGRPPVGWAVPDYVLSRFHQEEQEDLNSALEKAADAVEGILKLGMSNAMNRFNR